MNNGGDAAEQIVRLSLEGFEVAARISGSGAKNVAVLLYTLMKDKQKTAGKTNLNNMLKSGKELKVFSVKASEFQKFTQEAKRYGVLYSALVNKKDKNLDGIVDIMVRAEDASKINRIVERFKLAGYDEVSIRSEIEKTRQEKQRNNKPKSNEVKEKEEAKVKPIKKEEQSLNPHLAKTEKSPQSKPSSEMRENSTKGEVISKPSVKEKLNKIKEEVKIRDENKKVEPIKANEHINIPKKKSKEQTK